MNIPIQLCRELDEARQAANRLTIKDVQKAAGTAMFASDCAWLNFVGLTIVEFKDGKPIDSVSGRELFYEQQPA